MLRSWRLWPRRRAVSTSYAAALCTGDLVSAPSIAAAATSDPSAKVAATQQANSRPLISHTVAQFRALLASAGGLAAGSVPSGGVSDDGDASTRAALQLRYAPRPTVRVEGAVGGRPLSLEVGRIGPLADAVVRAQLGGACLLVSAVSNWALAAGAGAGGGLPLQVDYREKSFGAGAIPGSATRREPGTSDRETLAARAVDRALRPLFPRGYAYDTQVLVTVLSFDPDVDTVMLAITAASAALHVSDIPWAGPAAAVRVGWLRGDTAAAAADDEGVSVSSGQPVVAPAAADAAKSVLDLLYASGGGGSSVVCGGSSLPPPPRPHRTLMLEIGASQLPEAQLVEALRFAHDSTLQLLQLQDELRRLAGRPKRVVSLPLPSPSTLSAVRDLILADARAMYQVHGFKKAQRGNAQRLLALRVSEELAPRLSTSDRGTLGAAIDSVIKEALRGLVHDAAAAAAAEPAAGSGEHAATEGAPLRRAVNPLTGVPLPPSGTGAGGSAVRGGGADGAASAPTAQQAAEVIEAEADAAAAASASHTPPTGAPALPLVPVDAERCRPDGRSTTDIRHIIGAVDVLPAPVHGSALFSRGDTQVLCTVTLGPTDRALHLRSAAISPAVAAASPRPRKHFFLHYDFPPYSTNTTGRVGAAALNRRMVGHGALAERALAPVMPPAIPPQSHAATGALPATGVAPTTSSSSGDQQQRGGTRDTLAQGRLTAAQLKQHLLVQQHPAAATAASSSAAIFPYAIRVTSEVTGSDGSSSMATVCGACLALYDAGVPLSDAVAGISVGVFGPRLPVAPIPAPATAALAASTDTLASPDAAAAAAADHSDGHSASDLSGTSLLPVATSSSDTAQNLGRESSSATMPQRDDGAVGDSIVGAQLPVWTTITTSDASTVPPPDGYDTPGGRYVILSDIFGLEDHAGDCDFKVAGTRLGVTAAQLDVKPAGLPLAVIEQALWRARDARLRVLDAMAAVIPAPRAALKPSAPLVEQLELAPEGVSLLLAGGGGVLRRVSEATGAVICLDQERGPVPLLSVYASADALPTARRLLGAALEDHARLAGSPFAAVVPAGAPPLLVGDVVTATVSSSLEFGAVLSIGSHEVGWLHASELTDRRRVRVSDVLTPGDAITSMVVDIDARGRAKFSVRSLLRRDGGAAYVEAPDDYERLVVRRRTRGTPTNAVPTDDKAAPSKSADTASDGEIRTAETTPASLSKTGVAVVSSFSSGMTSPAELATASAAGSESQVLTNQLRQVSGESPDEAQAGPSVRGVVTAAAPPATAPQRTSRDAGLVLPTSTRKSREADGSRRRAAHPSSLAAASAPSDGNTTPRAAMFAAPANDDEPATGATDVAEAMILQEIDGKRTTRPVISTSPASHIDRVQHARGTRDGRSHSLARGTAPTAIGDGPLHAERQSELSGDSALPSSPTLIPRVVDRFAARPVQIMPSTAASAAACYAYLMPGVAMIRRASGGPAN